MTPKPFAIISFLAALACMGVGLCLRGKDRLFCFAIAMYFLGYSQASL